MGFDGKLTSRKELQIRPFQTKTLVPRQLPGPARLPRTSWRSRGGASPGLGRARGGPSGARAPAPRRSGTKGRPDTRGARAPRAATGTRLPEANEFYSPDPMKEPRPDSSRCSGGRSPHSIGALSRAQVTQGPALRRAERGRPGLRNPGRGRRRGSGATTRPPSLLERRGSLRLREEGRERAGGSPGEPPWKREAAAPVAHSPASRNHPLPW